MMEIVNGITTLILIILFIGIWVWAWSRRNQARFEQMAALPLQDDPISSGDNHVE